MILAVTGYKYDNQLQEKEVFYFYNGSTGYYSADTTAVMPRAVTPRAVMIMRTVMATMAVTMTTINQPSRYLTTT
eukprot:11026515-Ditylum_brightwellii.AAC.1